MKYNGDQMTSGSIDEHARADDYGIGSASSMLKKIPVAVCALLVATMSAVWLWFGANVVTHDMPGWYVLVAVIGIAIPWAAIYGTWWLTRDAQNFVRVVSTVSGALVRFIVSVLLFAISHGPWLRRSRLDWVFRQKRGDLCARVLVPVDSHFLAAREPEAYQSDAEMKDSASCRHGLRSSERKGGWAAKCAVP